jgi:formylglycine-generating enzyme required for sulfatase activity
MAPLAFRMGSPDDEQDRESSEVPHYRHIPRSIAVATKEVTIAQFKRFRPGYYPGVPDELPFAANVISWYSAAAYCNWLSQEAGIPPEEWCYPIDVSSGMALDASAVERTGYRLPTEAEWEYFARAGTETSRHFGDSEGLLPRYGWTWLNSGDETHIVGELLPNQFGLYDTLGNLWEWCHDGPLNDSYERPIYPYASRDDPALDVVQDETIRSAGNWRMIRGGAYNFTPAGARSAHRDVYRVENAAVNVGIRVVRTLPVDERGSAAD